ncbi:MAG: DNA-binding protein [Legionellaceae bacterium]|nr:DNA-binding protein [Legionellaceae bacterium]
MSIPAEIKDRVLSVASELYEASGRDKFPTVDEVRRAARADMNTTSALMKEWRKSQTTSAVPVVVSVPESIQSVFNQSIALAWAEAQNIAGEVLVAAQASWDDERSEADALRSEVSAAVDTLEQELKEAKTLNKQADQIIKERTEGLEMAREDIASAEKKYRDLESTSNQLKLGNTSLLARIEELKADLTASKNDAKSDLKAERERAEKQQDMLEKRHGTEKAQLLDEATKLRGRADVLAAEKAKVDMKSAQLEERVTQMTASLSQLSEAGKQAEKREESLLKQLDELTKSIAKMKPTDTKKTS